MCSLFLCPLCFVKYNLFRIFGKTNLMEKIIELSELIKARISILLLLPFWYLSLYLFHVDFYNNSDLILKVVTCLCLSLPAEFSISLSLTKVLMNRNYTEDKLRNLTDFSVFVLIKWLSFLIFISYVLKSFTSYYIPFLLFVCLFYFVPFLFSSFQLLHSNIIGKQKEGK